MAGKLEDIGVLLTVDVESVPFQERHLSDVPAGPICSSVLPVIFPEYVILYFLSMMCGSI